MSGALMECRGVFKDFETPRGAVRVLREVDLRVEPGELVAVVGKSGSGKSTLLNLLAALDHPSGGDVLVGGTSLNGLSERAAAAWRGRTVGIVFQFFQLLPGLSVIENVMLPMDFGGLFRGRREARARALLAQVGLEQHADKLPTALSGGEQQRVAVARALANDPPIVLADEPTGNLDSETSAGVNALLTGLAARGKTVLVVTHAAVELGAYSRVITMEDGRVRADRRTPAASGARP